MRDMYGFKLLLGGRIKDAHRNTEHGNNKRAAHQHLKL